MLLFVHCRRRDDRRCRSWASDQIGTLFPLRSTLCCTSGRFATHESTNSGLDALGGLGSLPRRPQGRLEGAGLPLPEAAVSVRCSVRLRCQGYQGPRIGTKKRPSMFHLHLRLSPASHHHLIRPRSRVFIFVSSLPRPNAALPPRVHFLPFTCPYFFFVKCRLRLRPRPPRYTYHKHPHRSSRNRNRLILTSLIWWQS